MRRVPCGSSTTSPASFSRRRCRDTAGRLIGNASATSPTDRPPAASSSTMARRLGSPSASNGSRAAAVTANSRCGAHPVVAGVVLHLGPAEALHDRRHVVGEATPEPLLEPVPAADGVVVGARPGLDRAGLRRLLLVGVAERHPVTGGAQHGVEVVETAEL